ncbi:MAG: hypothetical protein LBP74_01430 [Treponema sp.]|nr:hypothetical protein [Treponema sp.]
MPNLTNYLSSVLITTEKLLPRRQKAVTALLEEIEKRSLQRLELKQCGGDEWWNSRQPLIALGTNEICPRYPAEVTAALNKKALKAEGFQIISVQAPALTVIHGADDRGLLYGIGKLLRLAKITPGKFLLPENLDITDSPRFPLRGHQLGYRPKTNAYDAWTEQVFDQYIRELAFFGANSIEILPPRTDDDATGPHIKKDPLLMMERLSEIIDSYGLDVWIWYPNMGKDYSDKETLCRELAEREEIFSKLKRIDEVFIPGGDPGDLDADELFVWSEKVAALLHKYHPRARVWLSPQAFKPSDRWIESFYAQVLKEPRWLGGLVHGPWVKTRIAEMRKIVPAGYPIRNYPDITHSIGCQYPVPDWDLAFAKSLGRECINPRPNQEKHIHNLYMDYFAGSITYSEGINDDVNKFVWSGQDWNPDTPVIETLRDYARLFINPDRADDLAQGILALERNFAYPVAINKEIVNCLRQWQELERDMPFIAMRNYRFQMCLLRAHYDGYIKRRLAYETELELEALDILENSEYRFVHPDAGRAMAVLDKARTEPVARGLRTKCINLADLLFVNIGSQLTVDRHSAIAWDRGAFMDSIDTPLNDGRYLADILQKILKVEDEKTAFDMLQKDIINRTNPGPGGFYDSLGDLESWHRFPGRKDWKDDPGNLETPFRSFPGYLLNDKKDRMKGIPRAWHNVVAVLYDTPLTVCYENLDPESSYTLKIKYLVRGGAAGSFQTIRCMVNDDYTVHDYMEVGIVSPVYSYDLPQSISAGGKLCLSWTSPREDKQGTHIAEIFLRKTGYDT